MRIALYISPTHTVPPNEDRILAPWVLVGQIAERLAKRGHDVTLFAAKGSESNAKLIHNDIEPTIRELDNFSDIAEFNRYKHARDLELFRAVQSASKSKPFDVIHIHTAAEQLYPALAALRTKTPVVATFHDPVRPERIPALQDVLALGNIHFVGLSQAQFAGTGLAVAAVVPNGVDTELFRPDGEDLEVYKGAVLADEHSDRSSEASGEVPVSGSQTGEERHHVIRSPHPTGSSDDAALPDSPYAKNLCTSAGIGVNQTKPLLITGRIVPEKGFADAIAAAKLTGERLLMAGPSFPGIPAANAYFEKEIRPAIDGKTVMWEPFVRQEHLVGLYRRAKALLFPIHWPEPFGLVMVEAMACGTPVIAYANGSVPEVIKDGVTGFVVPPPEPEPMQGASFAAHPSVPGVSDAPSLSRSVSGRVSVSDAPAKEMTVLEKTHPAGSSGTRFPQVSPRTQISSPGVAGLVEAIGRIGEIDQKACRKHVGQNFSLARMVEGYEAVYKQVAGR